MSSRRMGIAVWTLSMLSGLCACKKDEPVSPCEGITCSGYGSCVVLASEAQCNCNSGYQADGLLCTPTSGTPTTNQIVQYGIAWTFDRQVEYGKYANGDFWVLGPVVVTRLAPGFDGAHHGWEVNPASTVEQGFDSRAADFDATRVPALPHTASPGESIVKSASLAPLNDTNCRPCLQTAAVLTVVGSVPTDRGATVFRPPYFGTDKSEVSTNNLQPGLLPSSLSPTEHTPTLADTANSVRRVQLDHKGGWTGADLHPSENMPEYGAGVADRTADIALRLMLNDSPTDKQEVLVLYVQQGLDLYAMARGGQKWTANGGHGEGRKLPITFAAVLLADSEMQTFVHNAGTDQFGENGGMYYSDAAHTVLYGQTGIEEEAYWRNLVFDTGSRTISDPYKLIDGGHRPGDSYQFCCLSMPWKATAAALLLMPVLQTVWNDQEFLDYVDRWVTFGAWTQPDHCAPPDGVCSGGSNAGSACTTASEPTACTGTDVFCDTTVYWNSHYGVKYGPDGSGGCIADTNTSGITGRFPLLHGSNRDSGYWGSGFAEEMWDAHVTP